MGLLSLSFLGMQHVSLVLCCEIYRNIYQQEYCKVFLSENMGKTSEVTSVIGPVFKNVEAFILLPFVKSDSGI